MASIERVWQDGQQWYPVGSAARLLGTTAPKVRELMGDGTLEWCQKGRSQIMMVSVASTEAYRTSAANPKRSKARSLNLSPDALARGANNLPKLGDRDRQKEEARRSDIFVRTWDPRAKD